MSFFCLFVFLDELQGAMETSDMNEMKLEVRVLNIRIHDSSKYTTGHFAFCIVANV
jgi:hypothetical protein